MELDWSVEREGEASLVGVRVRNDGAVPRRVRIESRLDGPVLPPRRGGVPEAGWDAEGVTTVIDPGERRAFGFAALADPVDPPVDLASVEPATPGADDDGRGSGSGDDLARTAVRDLESHRPPRRVVDGAKAGDRDGNGLDGQTTGSAGTETDRGGLEADGVEESSERTAEGDANGAATPDSSPGTADPEAIEAWFATVEARIERTERLTDADLTTATRVVEEADGLSAVAELDERVTADAERLKAVRDRAAALAERAEESDVPTEALEALA